MNEITVPASPFRVTVSSTKLVELLQARVGQLEVIKGERAAAFEAAVAAQRAAFGAAQAHGHPSVMPGLDGAYEPVLHRNLDRQVASLKLMHDLVKASSETSYTMTMRDLAQLDLIDVYERFIPGC